MPIALGPMAYFFYGPEPERVLEQFTEPVRNRLVQRPRRGSRC
jgi:hypothetical protein